MYAFYIGIILLTKYLENPVNQNPDIRHISPVKLAIFSLNPKQIATKGFFCIFVKNKYSYMTY